MLATARTFALIGVEARQVRVEADVRGGLPAFALVGLPDTALREARERVRAAIANSGFQFPQKRITVNLAPADLPKAGPGFDLALAAAVLGASEQLRPEHLREVALAGELALDGSVYPVPGALAMAEEAQRAGARAIAVHPSCAGEAALAGGIGVIPLERLEQLVNVGGPAEPQRPLSQQPPEGAAPALPDLADLRGQPGLRRALEVAAAGGHSLLVTGPPGAGKSMAARRLPSILPPLSGPERIEAIRIAGACGRPTEPPRGGVRPFRAPHHTISCAGLIGGGTPPRAGEVTLAHRGVLFLDELPEFRRDALEALRGPLEEARVLIARARHSIELPCRFQLVAAANPCPCGRGEVSPDCECDAASIRRYSAKLTGALADRIDIVLAIEPPDPDEIGGPPGEASVAVRERVLAARERQAKRLGTGRANAEMTSAEARAGNALEPQAERMMLAGQRSFGLSGRAHERVLRVARTVADLAGAQAIGADHVAEALAWRRRGAR